MSLSDKFRSHPALIVAFATLVGGYEVADVSTRSNAMDDLLDSFSDLGSYLLHCKSYAPDGLDERIAGIQSVSRGSEPYLVYEDAEEFGLIVTRHPELIIQAIEANELTKIGKFSPAELEAYRIHTT